MTDNTLQLREILVKKPWVEVQPGGYMAHRITTQGINRITEPIDRLRVRVRTQADFIRELNPSSHKINDPLLFPNIMKQDPDTKKWYEQPVTRRAFDFQAIIADKRTVHLTGNDLCMELSNGSSKDDDNTANVENLARFREGWLDKNMETCIHDSVASAMRVGDVAALIYRDKDGTTRYKVYSYLKDQVKLYPHFDDNGDLELFAIRYYDLDDQPSVPGGSVAGLATTEWVEIWDDTYHYVCKRSIPNGKIQTAIAKIKEIFGISGYEIVRKETHGCNRVPIAYYRNEEGPAWTRSQQTIEDYEEAMSYMGEGNKAFAFPIFYVKGEGAAVVGDLNGSVKSVDLPENGEAGFISRQEVSQSYQTETDKLYDLIYEQSFVVKPIQVKSGDLPGVAIKLLYSNAYEKAMLEAQEWQPFIDQLICLFKFYYGLETNIQASMLSLPINAWIEPYVHLNDAEVFQDLSMAVQNKFLSKQTASERISKWSKNSEYARIRAEITAETDEEIRSANAQAEKKEELAEKQTAAMVRIQLQAQNGGGNHAISDSGDEKKGGGKNRVRMTDVNGNRPFENNWRK